MPKTTTTYSLLVSCPGDVQEELKIIEEKVADFNITYGDLNDIRVDIKHWSKNSYPQSGGRAQALLNEQFVKECDLAVAVFWTRFGTATGEYGSGTEEEIELLLNEGKQVFLYFSNAPINPESIDYDQHQKVINFRKKYEKLEKGIYYKYNDIRDFEKNFLNHLSMHFLEIVTDKGDNVKGNKPQLLLSEARKGNPSKNVEIYNSNYLNSERKHKFREEITELFDQIKSIKLPVPVEEQDDISNRVIEIKSDKTKIDLSGLAATVEQMPDSLFADRVNAIDKFTKDTIEKYADENNIELIDKFFYLGNLKKSTSSLVNSISPFAGSQAPTYYGTDDEKNKHGLIIKLRKKIHEQDVVFKFLSELDNLFSLELMLCNSGNRFDEDIDVEIRFNKGCICKIEDLPVPNGFIVDDDCRYFYTEYFYELKDQLFAEDYSSGEIAQIGNNTFVPPMEVMLYGKSYDDHEQDVKDDINMLFSNYNFYEDGEEDVVQLKFGYLKHGKNMLFPSLLFFVKKPNYIKYEIKSKYQPEPTIGELCICDYKLEL